MNKLKSPILIIILSCFLFSSCSSILYITSLTAEIAGMTGAIDPSTANSIAKNTETLAKSSEAIETAVEAIGNAAEVITPEQEYVIGRQVAANLLGQYPLYSNHEATKYLNSICHAMVIHSEKPTLYKGYFVGILDSDEINAFATSGGHILITKGLLKCADTEDAIAAVIAHEIAHIQLQHSVKAIKVSRATIATLTTVSATAITLSNASQESIELSKALDESVNGMISVLVDSGYSISQEFAADKMALELMANAGYDASCMNDMLTLLEKNSAKKHDGFVKTHPSPEKRKNNLEKEYKKYSVHTPKECRTQRFLQNKENLDI